MSLTNFSLPFGALTQSSVPWSPTVSPLHPIHHQLAASTNNLLYSPVDHQQQPDDGAAPPAGSDFYKNNPYAPPQQTSYQYSSNNNNNNNNNSNGRRKNTYLPPIPPPGTRNTQYHHQAQQQQQQQYHQHPPQQFSHINSHQQQQQQTQQHLAPNNQNVVYKTAVSSTSSSSSSSTATSIASALTSNSGSSNTRTYGEGSYSRFPQPQNNNNNNNNNNNQQPPPLQQQQQQHQQYFNSFASSKQNHQQTRITAGSSQGGVGANGAPTNAATNYGITGPNIETPAATYGVAAVGNNADNSATQNPADNSNDPYPDRPPGFTRVQAGQGSRTGVHAVLDYDLEEGEVEDENYYDAEDHGEAVKDGSHKSSPMPTVTPIQGPIYLKNGTVPVVPLFHYPTFNNGSFVQIPIWWTALSVALGLDVRGDLIKGVPCIKRYHQLFCPTAGNSYPIEKIERFIDDNKALMRRMYGDFEMNMDNGGPRQQTKKRKRRFIDEPDIFLPPGAFPSFVADDEVEPHAEEHGESYFGKLRKKRQSNQGNRNQGNRNAKQSNGPGGGGASPTGRLDACESKVEIVTPYWASNSAGKIRAIVNTQHFEQAIHQEICSKAQTPRCVGECGCEQKYKWHRLLAYDPDNDCKGIFMDWFLFPSCCVCRCNP
ncbi:protein spaetzle 3 [Stomoxys calcitrans]|uniref:protein spaetzle 3 n=1 Tax=Stomoxys calcitrans TaxID=35570 RepID=UPI0027E23B6B|nr:protein spaetzle 3 [Stomoxys calcitrans]XP_059221828.1 protein spaetzle 3 [Stomoxys calcitrans]